MNYIQHINYTTKTDLIYLVVDISNQNLNALPLFASGNIHYLRGSQYNFKNYIPAIITSAVKKDFATLINDFNTV